MLVHRATGMAKQESRWALSTPMVRACKMQCCSCEMCWVRWIPL